MINRYAGLHCNGAEVGIKSLAITKSVKLGYGIETVKGQRPNSYTWLERCNSIDGITLDTQSIDASALEDLVTRNISGRQDSGSTWNITFNTTSEVVAQLEAMIAAYNAGQADENGPYNMWLTVWSPGNSKAFFVIAQPPQVLPMPSFEQNALQTIQLGFTMQEYKGQDTAIEPVEASA